MKNDLRVPLIEGSTNRKPCNSANWFLSPPLNSQRTSLSIAHKLLVFSRSQTVFRGVYIFGFLTLAVLLVLVLIESLYLLESSVANNRLSSVATRLEARNPLDATSNNTTPFEAARNSHWLIWTKKCHIPRLSAWDKSISGYVEYDEPLNCLRVIQEHKTFIAITYVDENRLRFRDFALQAQVVKRQLCCYKKINRGSDDQADLEYSDTCIKISVDGLEAPAALIQVRCDIFNYTNIHSFIVHDDEEELAISQIVDQNLLMDQYYNVIIVGVDTVSQLNGQRQFNQTLALLDGHSYKMLNFEGYNKVGENTFPNLIPLLAGLTPQQLIDTKCWLSNTYSLISETGDDFLDNCKYLWTFFQELGYLTYFSEDWPQASTFNYLKMGFKNPPTSFYGRPYTKARDPLTLPQINMGCAQCLYEQPLVELDLNNLKTFIQVHKARPKFAFHWINCPMHNSINGGSTVDSILANFFTDIREATKERTFVLFLSDHGYRWNDFVSTRIGHYEASLPMLKMSVPSHFVQHHPDLYENLKSHQSALITPFDLFHTIMDIRNLGASKKFVEPFIKSKVPLIRRKYLESSSPGETTKRPHRKDFLGELLEARETIATTSQIHPLNGVNFKQQFSTLSILTSHTPEQLDRSCDDAGIPDSYCVCMEFMPVPSDSPDVIGSALYLVYSHIYDILESHLELCNFLDLESITSSDRYLFKSKKPLYDRFSFNESEVREQLSQAEDNVLDRFTTPAVDSYPDSSLSGDHKLPNAEYRITVSTKPGQALFHEVVRMYGNLEKCGQEATEAKKLVNSITTTPEAKRQAVQNMNLVCKYVIHSESISRLNLYRDQSRCIKNQTEVKKVCYCR